MEQPAVFRSTSQWSSEFVALPAVGLPTMPKKTQECPPLSGQGSRGQGRIGGQKWESRGMQVHAGQGNARQRRAARGLAHGRGAQGHGRATVLERRQPHPPGVYCHSAMACSGSVFWPPTGDFSPYPAPVVDVWADFVTGAGGQTDAAALRVAVPAERLARFAPFLALLFASCRIVTVCALSCHCLWLPSPPSGDGDLLRKGILGLDGRHDTGGLSKA